MIMILIIMIMILIHSLVSNGDMEVVVCHKLMGSGEYIRAICGYVFCGSECSSTAAGYDVVEWGIYSITTAVGVTDRPTEVSHSLAIVWVPHQVSNIRVLPSFPYKHFPYKHARFPPLPQAFRKILLFAGSFCTDVFPPCLDPGGFECWLCAVAIGGGGSLLSQ